MLSASGQKLAERPSMVFLISRRQRHGQGVLVAMGMEPSCSRLTEMPVGALVLSYNE